MLIYRFLCCLFLFFFLWQNLSAQTQLIPFQTKKKWGFLLSDGRIAIKAQFDDAYVQNNGYIWVRKKKKFGLINPEGKEVHPCKFDMFDIVKLGYSNYTKNYCFTVKKGKKWGVMGKRGELYQPFELDTVHDFHDTHVKSQVDFEILARAEKNKKVGFINLKGKWAIPCEYDDLERFHEDYCIAKKNNKYGVIDRNNLNFIPFEYDKIQSFGSYFMAQKGGKWGIVNQKHVTLHPFVYDSLIYSQPKYKSLAYARNAKHYLNENLVCGYIGEEVITRLGGQEIKGLAIPTRDDNTPFESEGNFYALKMPIHKEGAIVIPKGEVLLDADYDDVSLLKMNKWLLYTKDKKSGVMDSAGKIIFPPEYRYIDIAYDNEKAVLQFEREEASTLNYPKYVVLQKAIENPKKAKDKNNKEGNNAEAEPYYDEDDEYYPAPLDESGEEEPKVLKGLADSTGKIIFPPEYKWVGKYHAVKKEGKHEVLYNRRKQIAFPSNYEKLYVITPNRVVGVKDKKVFWLDTLGKAHVNPNGFAWFIPISNHRYWIFDGKRQRIIDENAKPVFPEEYDRFTLYFPIIGDWVGSGGISTNENNFPLWWRNRPDGILFPNHFPEILSFSHVCARREKDKKIALTDSLGKLLNPDILPADKITLIKNKGAIIVETGDNSRTLYTGVGTKHELKNCEYAEPIYPSVKGLAMDAFFQWQKDGTLPDVVKNKINHLRDPKMFGKLENAKPAFLALNRHEKWAIADTNGKMITGLDWDVLTITTLDSLLIVGRNEHWGVEGCDNYAYGFVHKRTGKMVQDCKYLRNNYRGGPLEDHPYYGKKMIVVRTPKGYGLLNNVGKEIQPCIYDNILPFSPQSLLLVKNKVAGIVDWNGKWLVDTILDADQAREAREGEWLEKTFNRIRYNLHDPKTIDRIKSMRSYLIVIKDKKKNKFAYFDLIANKLRTDFVYDQARDVGPYDNAWAKKNNQYLYMDTTLTPTFNLDVDSIKHEFEERIYLKRDSVVKYYVAARHKDKWGVIDNNGKIILPFHWENMALNQHYRYYAVAKHGGKFGVVDFNGRVILDYQYDSVALLNRKLFGVREKIEGPDSVRWKLVNAKGKELAETKSKDNLYVFTMHDKAAVQTGDTLMLYHETGRLNDEIYTDMYGFNGLAKNFVDSAEWHLPPLCVSAFPVQKNKAIGVIDTLGNEIIPFKYDEIASFERSDNYPVLPNLIRYWIVKKSGTFETFTKKGNPINQDSMKIHADLAKKKLAVVEKFGKVGVTDSNFKTVIPYQYDFIRSTNAGHWIVGKKMNETTRYGLLDSTGKEIIDIKYKDVSRVARGGSYGSEDDFETEDPDLVPQSASGYKLKEYLSPPKLYKVKDEKDKEGWIDFSGKTIVPCKYDDIDRTSRRDCWFITLDKKYGWIDSSGTEKAPAIFDDIIFDKHAKEFARVEIDDHFGILKYDGTEILPVQYEDIGILRNNLILVKKDSLWGMFDFQLKPVLNIEYENAEDYGCSCCPDIRFTRMRKNGKVGLSMNGQLILPCEYADISEVYANGLVEVRTTAGGKWGLVEKLTGKRMTDFEYDQVYVLEGSLEDVFVKVRIDDKYGLVSAFGQTIPCQWDEIRSVNANAIAGRKDKKWFLLDLKGNPLQAKSFDSILGEYQSIKKKTADED